MSTPHLLVDVADHGYGHFAQTVAVLNQLRDRRPAVRLTLRCGLPRAVLAGRLHGEFDHLQRSLDFGMRMASSIDVLAAASHQHYVQRHRNWTRQVADEAATLRSLQPDLVLSNVSSLSLAAASRAGLPSVALCSLNWADIYAHYCRDMPGATEIIEQMQAAYCCADVFLQPVPHMPMDWLPNRRPIAPVAAIGTDRRDAIRTALQLSETCRLVLINFGGMPTPLPVQDWPPFTGTHWLVPRDWQLCRDDCTDMEILMEQSGFSFTDILRSSDAIITKPGYGIVAETACNRIPVLYVARGDWPEEPYLLDWLHRQAPALAIGREELWAGDIAASLDRLLALPKQQAPQPTGAAEAADIIGQMLG